MKKIKVLQVPIANTKGGTTQYALNNWKHIDKSKFQFDFVTLSKKLDFEDELNKQGCKVYYVSCYAEENEGQFIDEMNQVLSNGYDVIHIHTNCWKSFLVEELAIAHKIPKIIVHAHNSMVLVDDEEQRKKAIKLHELRKSQFSTELATDYWACSQVAADWLFGEQIPKKKIVIMKNAIDLEKFQFNNSIRLKYRKDLDLDNNFVIGHVGRFAYQKNHEFIINLFKLVREKNDKAKLVLIGGGPLEDLIRQKVNEYNLSNDVVFLGKREDVNSLIQSMDIFVLPSQFEGLPIVLIEGQAAGLKCIASDNITKEVEITDNMIRIPLDINIWAENIIRIADGYARCNKNEIITQNGYNILNQIKIIEEEYCTP